MPNVTQLLEAAQAGDRQAAVDLLPIVYDELRKLAAAKMVNERADHTLDATALVHEAYLRLVGPVRSGSVSDGGSSVAHASGSDRQFENRRHFFAAAAESMRRILIENARRRGRLKRGGERVRLELLDQAGSLVEDPTLVLSLEDLLARLESEDSLAARIANLHLFGGLSVEESSEVAGCSRAVAFRHWKYARAWLRDALEK